MGGEIQTVIDFLKFLATNEIILGICSLLGIAGFVMTLFVTIKTSKIAKILKYNQVTEAYNKERIGFQKAFEGHRSSISEDDIKTDKLLKDILKQVEAYRIKFNDIFSFKERITLYRFIKILKRPAKEVDFNTVCNYLASLSGRLSKKEDKKNG